MDITTKKIPKYLKQKLTKLKGKNEIEGQTLSNFKTYYKTTIMKLIIKSY